MMFVRLVQALAWRFSLSHVAPAYEVHTLMRSMAKRSAKGVRDTFGFIGNPVGGVVALEQPMRNCSGNPALVPRSVGRQSLEVVAWFVPAGVRRRARRCFGSWGEGATRLPEKVARLSRRVAAALF